jgi:hypothetical protein
MYILGLISLYIAIKRLNVNKFINMSNSYINEFVTFKPTFDKILNKTNITRTSKNKTDEGYDERFSKNISYDNDVFSKNFTYDEEKLIIFYKKANILNKLTSRYVSDLEKIKAVKEMDYLSNSSKYIPNIQSAGLYDDWSFNIQYDE